jgi:hypothetical protein
MSKAWETNGTTFEAAPTGVHDAICVKIVDLGTQTSEYKGEELKRRQNLIIWELPEELREDGQPFTISKFYTASLNEKSNLYADLTSWLGKPPEAPFNPEDLLGKGCQLIVTEKNDKHVVSTVAGLKKNAKLPKPVNELVHFTLDEFDETVFDNLSNGLKKMVMRSPEYAKIVTGEDEPEEDSEIPF